MKDFTVSPAFSSHMILQRHASTRIWGKARRAGITITVEIGNYSAKATSDIEKRWEVVLENMKACCVPQTLTISSENHTVVFDDVLIGEVYLVTGQSNAEMPFSMNEQTQKMYADTLNETGKYPLLRALIQARSDNLPAEYNKELHDTFANSKKSTWRVLNSKEAVEHISMLGYFFVKYLHLALDSKIPVGFVQAASGGSPLYELEPIELTKAYSFKTQHHEEIAIAGMYNAMIAPVQNMTISGILFYQGESEMVSDTYRYYGYQMQSYATELRRRFRANVPFYYVQLSSHPDPKLLGWQYTDDIRNAQFDALHLIPNSYMIVSRDHGWRDGDPDMAHPSEKEVLGKRACDLALAVQYQAKPLEYVSSPVPYEAKFSSSKAVVRFKYVADGLCTYGKRTLVGFELCDETGKYHPAKAKIISPDTVEVTGVKHPTAVRFGKLFLAYMEYANLQNSQKLPAPCFEMYKDTFHLNLYAPL